MGKKKQDPWYTIVSQEDTCAATPSDGGTWHDVLAWPEQTSLGCIPDGVDFWDCDDGSECLEHTKKESK